VPGPGTPTPLRASLFRCTGSPRFSEKWTPPATTAAGSLTRSLEKRRLASSAQIVLFVSGFPTFPSWPVFWQAVFFGIWAAAFCNGFLRQRAAFSNLFRAGIYSFLKAVSERLIFCFSPLNVYCHFSSPCPCFLGAALRSRYQTACFSPSIVLLFLVGLLNFLTLLAFLFFHPLTGAFSPSEGWSFLPFLAFSFFLASLAGLYWLWKPLEAFFRFLMGWKQVLWLPFFF